MAESLSSLCNTVMGRTYSSGGTTTIRTFHGHFDVGGFGAGSDFTWQAYPYLNWRFTKWGSAQLGYRWLGTDYETGSGRSRFIYDVVVQGPQLGFTIHF